MRKEADVLRAVLDYLTVRKVFHFRINNTGIYDPKKGVFRKPGNIMAGVSDIICLKDSKMICLEIKSPDGILSPNQIIFSQKISWNGGLYFTVRSVDDVIKIGL